MKVDVFYSEFKDLSFMAVILKKINKILILLII